MFLNRYLVCYKKNCTFIHWKGLWIWWQQVLHLIKSFMAVCHFKHSTLFSYNKFIHGSKNLKSSHITDSLCTTCVVT